MLILGNEKLIILAVDTNIIIMSSRTYRKIISLSSQLIINHFFAQHAPRGESFFCGCAVSDDADYEELREQI
jgi:hypothetical protein